MLPTRFRVRPCRPRTCRESSRRLTTTAPLSIVRLTAGSTGRSSVPLGPSTRTRPSVTCTFTPAGSLIGILPIRDIGLASRLPDGADDLAPDVLAAGGTIDEDTLRGGQHVHAEPAADGGNF